MAEAAPMILTAGRRIVCVLTTNASAHTPQDTMLRLVLVKEVRYDGYICTHPSKVTDL